MGGKALEDKRGRERKCSLMRRGWWKTLVFMHLGGSSPQMLADDAGRSFWLRPQARPAQTSRKGRFLAGRMSPAPDAHSAPSKNCRIRKRTNTPTTDQPGQSYWIHRNTKLAGFRLYLPQCCDQQHKRGRSRN